MLRRLLPIALAGALALPAAGCTDDAPPTQARGGRVDVTLDDFFISPQRIRARPGRITFHVTDHGQVGHTLRVLRGDREVAKIKTLLPGGSADASGRFTRGDYKLMCILGNHEILGMRGTLTVR